MLKISSHWRVHTVHVLSLISLEVNIEENNLSRNWSPHPQLFQPIALSDILGCLNPSQSLSLPIWCHKHYAKNINHFCYITFKFLINWIFNTNQALILGSLLCSNSNQKNAHSYFELTFVSCYRECNYGSRYFFHIN